MHQTVETETKFKHFLRTQKRIKTMIMVKSRCSFSSVSSCQAENHCTQTLSKKEKILLRSKKTQRILE
jgi:hypothetical protein